MGSFWRDREVGTPHTLQARFLITFSSISLAPTCECDWAFVKTREKGAHVCRAHPEGH